MAPANNLLQMTPEEDEELCSRALQLSCGAVLPMILKTAIELGLLEILVEAASADATTAAALSAEEITARLPAEKPQVAAAMVDRILRLLAASYIVGCAVVTGADGRRSRKYSTAPICKYLTKNENGSIAYLVLLHQDKVFMDIWHYLKDSVLDGGHPVEAAYGMSSFEYQGTDPRFNEVFNNAMQGHSTIIVNNLLRVYGGFDDVNVLVDVGGGIGATLGMITARHPHIKGINFDLPHVISAAHPLPVAGVEHISGDMSESIPGGDAIFMKWILHDWADEHCTKILKNCWRSLPEKGKVIVVECVVPVAPESTPKAQAIFQLDICMSTYNIGGKERTEEEFKALGSEAGFVGFNALHVFAGYWVMEFTKQML